MALLQPCQEKSYKNLVEALLVKSTTSFYRISDDSGDEELWGVIDGPGRCLGIDYTHEWITAPQSRVGEPLCRSLASKQSSAKELLDNRTLLGLMSDLEACVLICNGGKNSGVIIPAVGWYQLEMRS